MTEWDVYCAFRKAQSNASGRGYRLPKDWDAFKEKMTKQNGEWLYKAMVYFNTTYSNIDIDVYMACGFELWKGFTYKQFCDQRVIESYIQKDKIKKRKLTASAETINQTFDFIDVYLKDMPTRVGYTQLQNFCKLRAGEVHVIINMYNLGRVDMLTLTYCIVKRYLILTDDERSLVPYIVKRYRELQEGLEPMLDLIKQKERELDERTGQ